MNPCEPANSILPERDESFQALFIIDKKDMLTYNIIDRSLQERESDFCRQKTVQRDLLQVTWKNWTKHMSGIPLPR